MARHLRGPIEPGIYHVTRRSAGPVAMFHDDVDRTDFCNRVGRAVSRFGWTCHAFCLMSTHYHLLLAVEEDRLQPGMHALNGPYAQQFNKRHGRKGHLRGSPYGARLIVDDDDFLHVVRYIVRNPVTAGICEAPSSYIWSSYRGCAGYEATGFPFVSNELVLRSYHADVTQAQRLLRLHVEAV